MSGAALPVRERFSAADGEIVRKLRIGGVCGVTRAAAASTQGAEALSQRELRDAWDVGFLRGGISNERGGGWRRAVRIADVFCGAGGLSYGVSEAVRAAGMVPKMVLAADVDDGALDVYRRNFDPVRYSNRNVWTSVTTSYSSRRSRVAFRGAPRALADAFRASVGEVDILLGGPPCEGHSTSNNRTLRDDPRNKLYIAMPALAVALGAKCVIVENVPGVQHDSRHVLEDAKALFESEGYSIDDTVVDAVRLGLAQTRKRHILVASKFAKPNIAAAVDALARPERDLRWAIGDLEDVIPQSIFDAPADLVEVNRLRIDYLFDNGEYNMPNHMRPDSHKNGNTYPSIYGRLRWDKPSGTITTGFNTPGRGRYIHPSRRRTITAHEAARIQGFPDSFEFAFVSGDFPTRTALATMIGDAAPPQLGYAAGAAALAAMDPSYLGAG